MGYAANSSCFATLPEAASEACGSLLGTTSNGTVSCDAVVSTTVGTSSAVLTVRRLSGSTVTTSNHTLKFQTCDVRDVGYYAPTMAAFLLALAAIHAAKYLLRLWWPRGI